VIYITGDTHGNFLRVKDFCSRMETSRDNDTMIVLGDAGLNFYLNKTDRKNKQQVNSYPIKIFCIHGNHEERPYNIDGYEEVEYRGGIAYIEPEYPNIIFGKDGELYDFDGIKCFVIGGAYSVDKEYRLLRNIPWFESEQADSGIMERVNKKLDELNWTVDVMLTHTVPLEYEPVEVFLPFIDQRNVDKTMEKWLDEIKSKLNYKKWYAGHYHTSKKVDKLQIMFNDFDVLST